MTTHKLFPKIVDAGIALAYSQKGAGIAAVWAEFLRQHIRIIDDPASPVKTWMVDGEAVHINAAWTESLSAAEMQFLLAHETLHIALDHVNAARAAGADTAQKQQALNIAEDAVINTCLMEDGIGRMPEGDNRGVTMEDFTKQGYDGPRESLALYEWIMANQPPKAPKGGSGQGKGGQGSGQQGASALKGCAPEGMPGTPGKGGAEAEEIRMKVERARATLREASTKAGGGSALAELLAPRPVRASVRSVIRAQFERASMNARNRTVPSYSRASRRMPLAPDVLLAGRIGTEARVAFIGDVSGSMDEDGVATLVGMIESVAREFPETSVYLVTHTSEVVWEGKLRAGGDLSKAKQAAAFSGGTSFAPAYDAVRKAGRFDVVVHFTDGYNAGPWPESPARDLVVGLWGAGHDITTPPPGAKVLPVASIKADR